MIKKSYNTGAIFAWRFRFGLEAIERAYESSRSTADSEKRRLERNAQEVEKDLNSGEEMSDDDSNNLRDYQDALGGWMAENESVLTIIRAAFVISVFHYLEKEMNSKLKVTDYDEKKVFSTLREWGGALEVEKLIQLRLLANCAKHSEGNSATRLYEMRPDLFDAHKIGQGKPGADSLVLTDAHVEEFFSAVRKSMPSGRMRL